MSSEQNFQPVAQKLSFGIIFYITPQKYNKKLKKQTIDSFSAIL
jgi:hypothetical protein